MTQRRRGVGGCWRWGEGRLVCLAGSVALWAGGSAGPGGLLGWVGLVGDAGGSVVGAVEVEVSRSGVGVGDAPAGDGDGDEEFEGALEGARAELAVISGAGDGLDDGLGPGETKACCGEAS